jgi:hypothetical protein
MNVCGYQKRYSEATNWKGTDNATAKRIMTKKQPMVDKTLQDTNTNSRRQNTTRHKYKQSSTKHYKTQIQTVVGKNTTRYKYKQSSTKHKHKQSSAKHYKTQIQTVVDKTLQDTNANSRRQSTTHKLKIEQNKFDLNRKDLWYFRRVCSSCFTKLFVVPTLVNKGNNNITELRTILQRESQNS